MFNTRLFMFFLLLALSWTTVAPAQIVGNHAVVPDVPATFQTDQRPKVLLACIGGWRSCTGQNADDQYIAKSFLKLVEQVRYSRPDLDISYVMFCSRGVKTARFSRPVNYYGRFGAGTAAEENIGSVIAMHKESPSSKVFIMGHSHGGWMAMRAALSLGHVDGLFTLEPVSAAECDIRKYFRNKTRKIFKGIQRPVAGCRRAPQDLDHQAIYNACSGNWTNFVLSVDSPRGDVYSSSIPIANNVGLYAAADEDFSAHQNLGTSDQAWSIIQSSLLSRLSRGTVATSIATSTTRSPSFFATTLRRPDRGRVLFRNGNSTGIQLGAVENVPNVQRRPLLQKFACFRGRACNSRNVQTCQRVNRPRLFQRGK